MKSPLLYLLAVILLAAVLFAASMAKAADQAIGHADANVCKPCSVIFCDDCPDGLEEFKANGATEREIKDFAIKWNQEQARIRYCADKAARHEPLPDFCFVWSEQ